MKHARADYQGIQDTTGQTTIPGDEPVFILRAKDLAAAAAIRSWIETSRQLGVESRVLAAVGDWADIMEDYRLARHGGGKPADTPPGLLFNEGG